MVTSKDVAARAGVAQSTVSYVMSGSRNIAPATRARVEEAMRELGYHPNASARALKMRRSQVLGLVIHFSASTELAGILPFIETITGAARERDHDVVLVTADEGPTGIERLARRGIVDGFVVMDVTRDDDRIPALREIGLPSVFIGQPDDASGLHVVDFDGGSAGRAAVSELVGAGSTAVTVIGEPESATPVRHRFITDFEHGAAAAGKAEGVHSEVLRPTGVGWQNLADVVRRAVRAGDGPHGLVARTPQTTERVEQILLEDGLVPGRDVYLVGICEDDFAQELRVPATNISSRPRELSRIAVDTLFAELEGRGGSIQELHLVPPLLTRRETTRVLLASG